MFGATIFLVAAFSGCFGGKGDDTPSDSSNSVDETATYDGANADQASKVSGTLTGAGTALATGAVQFAAVDSTTSDDSAGALDKANLTLDVTEADGTRIQASLRAMTTAAEAGMPDADFYGGVNHNFDMHGDSGAGVPEFPKAKSYVWFAALARIAVNGVPMDDLQLVTVWAGRGLRAADGSLLTAADAADLEVHVVFPGSLVAGKDPLTPGNNTDGFLYYYFERVELKTLTLDEKGQVGSKLQAARPPNKPPVAAAAVVFEDGTTGSVGVFDPAKKFLNVTLDASNSTDPDGPIEAYSWSISQYNETGVMVPYNRTTGVKALGSFDAPGLKRIDLRVIDEFGGIGNTTMFFFVDYKAVFAHAFGTSSDPAQTAGGGQNCMTGSNCFDHRFTVTFGAVKATFTAPANVGGTGTACQNSHLEALAPPGTAVTKASAANGALTLDAAQLAKLGGWRLNVWYEAHVKCSYTLTATVQYSPPAPAT
ncbi:MAG: hypothetical protein HYT80_09860 [Euryarchaeota archaeon]|nr:hypothetical protein [Euryarchaeota archaeon]